jgi:Fic family protein
MNEGLADAIILVVGLGIGYWLGVRNGRKIEEPQKAKVRSLFGAKNEITNDDVQRALSVSDATATRVLDAMERDGTVAQVGATGAGVVYRLK